MEVRRKDNKNRVLRKGESQRSNGLYMYRYRDLDGVRKTEYSWRLDKNDPYSKGKKKDLSLREKIELIERDLMDGLIISGGIITVNELFDKYLKTKRKITDNVRDTYTSQYFQSMRSDIVINPELLPIITPHILRHTYCSKMAEGGMDVKVLQKIMGHKRVDTLMNIYNHADIDRVSREFERIENAKSLCL